MARGGHGRRRGHGAEHESEERWLLTYADMITLLMALFMVLFSISSVNISKYQTLQKSLKAAFSGHILPGGTSVASAGGHRQPCAKSRQRRTAGDRAGRHRRLSQPAEQHFAQHQHRHLHKAAAAAAKAAAANHQASEFARIKAELEAYAKAHGFAKSVKVAIEQRGLVIRVLTDDLLFASGKATLEGRAFGLLTEIASLLNVDQTHPISVEGNTDNVPIHSSLFPSNWELSTARASTVVQYLIAHGVSANRLTASGNAEQRPIDSNATAAGRARNRRVEIVMRRLHGAEGEPEAEGESEP